MEKKIIWCVANPHVDVDWRGYDGKYIYIEAQGVSGRKHFALLRVDVVQRRGVGWLNKALLL